MTDFILAAILLVMIGGAAAYIAKAKKSGAKCIGCPSDGACAQKGSASCCGCHSEKQM